MKITKESSSPIEVTLNIEMDVEDEDPFIDRSYRRTVSRLNIPGFRKGKAPRSIVESYVGRIALIQEALDFMIPETLDKALQSEELQAFVEPRVEITELEPVSFTATVPLEPNVDLGDFYSTRLEKELVEVTDQDVDDALERLRGNLGAWEPVERPAEYGDLLNLMVKGSMDDEEVINDEGVDYILREENVLPFPGFAPYLEGMAEGEDKDFTMTVPEDYPRAEYAGREVDFQVTVGSIKEKILPELDDEFAQGVGEGYETLEALREYLVDNLTAEAQSRADYDLQERGITSLMESVTVQVSDLLLEREVEGMQRERERMLNNQRLDMDSYLAYLGQTEEEFVEELRPQAEERVNRMLALRKLAQEEEIAVTAEEVRERVEVIVSSYPDESAAQMRRFYNSADRLEAVHSTMFNDKVMQRLMEIVQGLERGALDLALESEADAAAGETEGEAEAQAPEVAMATPANEAETETETDEAGPTAEAAPSETEGTEEGAKPDAV